MDVISFVITIYDLTQRAINIIERARECIPEAERLRVRLSHLAVTIGKAKATFSKDVQLQKTLVSLHGFMSELNSFLDGCMKLTGARFMMKRKRNAEIIKQKESELEALCQDLGLAMMPLIGEKLDTLPDEILVSVTRQLDEHHKSLDSRISEGFEAAVQSLFSEKNRVFEERDTTSGGKLQGQIVEDRLVESDEVLGEGSFGIVRAGTYFGKKVAIKRATQARLPPHIQNELRWVRTLPRVPSVFSRR